MPTTERATLGSAATSWPFTGRGELVTALRAGVAEQRTGGIVVVGPAGAGKTRLVGEAIDDLDDEYRVLQAVGHAAAAEIPLGALAHLLPSSLFERTGVSTDERTALFHTARAFLTGDAETTSPGTRSTAMTVLAIDDIDLLDDTSLALLVPSIVARDLYVIGTVRSGRTPSSRLSRLHRDGHLERLDLGPLPAPDVGRLIRHVLGGPVDEHAVDRLTELSGGNLQILTELVRGGRDRGWLTIAAGKWVIGGRPTATVQLDELIAEHLADVDEAGRDVLEHLALSERLGLADLEAAFGSDVLTYLEREGLIELVQSQRRAAVRLAHPLFGEILDAQLPALRRRTLLRRLADLVEAHGARRRDDELRVVSWRIRSGGDVALPRRIHAARVALLGHDPELAIDLLHDATTEHVDDAADGITNDMAAERLHLLGEAAASLGRVDAAIDHLAAATELNIDDTARARIAVRLADVQFFTARDLDGALATCARVGSQINDETARATIEAQRAVTLANAGQPVAALEALDGLSGTLDPRTSVDVLVARSASLISVGQCTAGVTLAREAADAQQALPEWLARRGSARHVINEAHGLGYAGHYDAARAVLEPAIDRARTSGAMSALVWFELALSELTRDIGLPGESLEHAAAAAELGESAGQQAALVWAYVGVAQAHLLAGRSDDAARAIDLATAIPSPVATSAATLQRASAWLDGSRGELAAAREQLLTTAAAVRSDGVTIFEMALLHDVVRFGDAPTVVDRLTELAPTLDGPIFELFADHAVAAHDADGAALIRCADRFENNGNVAFAAEAAAEAADQLARDGDQRAATAQRVRAAALAEAAGGLDTPPLRRGAAIDPLTAREREIALLAADGEASKAIASRLVLSTRTVDTHLARVYRKLGISGRAELRQALSMES
ncbi:MAG: LuxR C-terminal-related transcriptional regulator [Actinomycetota bacterium]